MKRSFYFTHLARERPEVDVVIASLNVRFSGGAPEYSGHPVRLTECLQMTLAGPITNVAQCVSRACANRTPSHASHAVLRSSSIN
jgi:hypothetical protein